MDEELVPILIAAARRPGGVARALVVAGLVAALACGRRPRGEAAASAAPSGAPAPVASGRSGAAPVSVEAPLRVAPETLLTLDSSAYGARIALDDEAAYLFVADGAHRLVPGRAPLRMPLDLGLGPVLTRTSVVFWSQGAIFAAPKRGGPARRLGEVPHQPQYLVTSGDRFAWLDRAEDGRFTIQTLDEKRARVVYAPAGPVATLTMLHDWVFFVEQLAPSSWRLGGVSLAGGTPTFTAAKQGRTPAALATASDLYFYDGSTLTVRRVSPDLEQETILAQRFICSPIAVSDRILCAQVGGLFELRGEGSPPVALVERMRGPVTAIAADSAQVVWVTDAGRDRLAVERLPLAPLRPAATRP